MGLLVSVAAQILNKSGRDEQATLLSIAGIVIILLIVVEKVGELISTLREVFGL